ncbi:MAG: hypothetical protein AAF653_13200 [Chloroflexota bacterium]
MRGQNNVGESPDLKGEAIIRQERRIGELIRLGQDAGEIAREGTFHSNQHTKEGGNGVLPPNTLSDIGISKMESSRAQSVASIPEPEFEQYITA